MKDWIVKNAYSVPYGSGLLIVGVNNCTTVEIDREFRWNIGHYSVNDERYDWSNTVWAPGAKERFEQLQKLAAR